jgi:hypothetical protein
MKFVCPENYKIFESADFKIIFLKSIYVVYVSKNSEGSMIWKIKRNSASLRRSEVRVEPLNYPQGTWTGRFAGWNFRQMKI